MTDPSRDAPTPIFTTDRPRPDRPVLVAGLAGSALLNGAGEISWVRETRGAPIDWGGVYGQGVRLTGPWALRLLQDGGDVALGRETLRSLIHDHGGVRATHRVGSLEVHDELAPLASAPGVGRRLYLARPTDERGAVTVECSFDPFLVPVLIEGVKPDQYRADLRGTTVVVDSHGFVLAVDVDRPPDAMEIGGTPWGGERRDGNLRGLTLRWRVSAAEGNATSLTMCVLGGLERTLRNAPGRAELSQRTRWRTSAEAAWVEWVGRTPTLEFPDAPELEEGYRLARQALWMLYTAPEPGFEGLVAGYPWYSAIWCRDLAWMLPAVEWLGDAEWVERSLATVFRFQALARLPILAAEPGELPMQISPGPLLLYGTSDTSLYYPGIVQRHVEQTGVIEPARRWFPVLERIVELGIAKSDASTGLLTNGGELEGMRQASSFGNVHVGFDAVDTTIWDSTDRRDHAIDVQVLWADALESVGAIGRALGHPTPGPTDRAARIRETVRARYAWPNQRFLYDSLRKDGSPVAKLRPNALRVVNAGWLDGVAARTVVRRAAEEDLSTPWGVRTLSSRDPGYDPRAYHDGQVWTIATAWAADAALSAGEAELGVGYLRTNAQRLIDEGGYANECYRGDSPEPFDSCFLLGFSVAPFLTTLFRALWGLVPHMLRSAVGVRPRFPKSWTRARLHDLRLGRGRLSLEWSPGRVEARWTGPNTLCLEGELGSIDLAPGTSAGLSVPSAE